MQPGVCRLCNQGYAIHVTKGIQLCRQGYATCATKGTPMVLLTNPRCPSSQAPFSTSQPCPAPTWPAQMPPCTGSTGRTSLPLPAMRSYVEAHNTVAE